MAFLILTNSVVLDSALPLIQAFISHTSSILDGSNSVTLNSFLSPSFNTNVGVGQGFSLSPIISAIYMAPIIETFKKRIKNLKDEILTDLLFFVDNSLLISQDKSYDLSFSFLFCSYNSISNILLNSGLAIEHSKSEVFHFTQSQNPLKPPINLTSVGGPILIPVREHPRVTLRSLDKLLFMSYYYLVSCVPILSISFLSHIVLVMPVYLE